MVTLLTSSVHTQNHTLVTSLTQLTVTKHTLKTLKSAHTLCQNTQISISGQLWTLYTFTL